VYISYTNIYTFAYILIYAYLGYIFAKEISRIQEYRADERAAEIVGPKPMISVIHIFLYEYVYMYMNVYRYIYK
jgi:Zn-dependent protease with chaperone function